MLVNKKIGTGNFKVVVIGLLMVAMIIAGICAFYIRALKITMNQERDRYLSEISHHVSLYVDYQVNAAFQLLDALAETYLQIQDQDFQLFFDQKARRYGYLKIGIIDKEGFEYINGNKINVLDNPYVQSALNGNNSLTLLEDNDTIWYLVPIRQEGKVVGSISAYSASEKIQSYLNAKIFSGDGFTAIVDRNGGFIIHSLNKKAPENIDNIFELIEKKGAVTNGSSLTVMRMDMQENRSGMLFYEMEDGIGKVMNYVPLHANDWYLLSIVPTKVTEAKTVMFIHFTVLMSIIIVTLFMLLILIVTMLNRRNQKKLGRMAFVDPVTKGFNRVWFETVAGQAIREAEKNTYSLASLDIQKFKLINEAFGSIAGNDTLKHIHDTIKKQLQEEEYVTRISADTFNILIKYAKPENILKRFDNIAEDINVFNHKLIQKYYLPIRVGVYTIEDPTLDMITIQDRANVARKNNKNGYLNRLAACMFYTDVERMRMIREKEIDNRMEIALENKEFVVYLQPKVELDNQTIAGAEALVRWIDPEKGLIPPDEFIPVFEKNRFIINIDLYVFQTVCEILQNWIDKGMTPLPISVNLSRVHLSNPDFLDAFKEVFSHYSIPASLLEIELTETLVFENLEVLIDVIHKIHNLGFRCSLDDFGNGYSSLNMLKDVPADVLKLDRAFFVALDESNKRGEYVIESVIELARKLNMQTVSEGVETPEQVAFLTRAKCDMVQGYVFSKPVPVSEFEKIAFSDYKWSLENSGKREKS